MHFIHSKKYLLNTHQRLGTSESKKSLDIIPVLGTGTVVIPWAIYSFFVGNIGTGIGLILLYVVITVLRQVLEPKLVARQAGLPSTSEDHGTD